MSPEELDAIEKACLKAGTGGLDTRTFAAMALAWIPALVQRVRELEARLAEVEIVDAGRSSAWNTNVQTAIKVERETCAAICDLNAEHFRLNHQGHSETVARDIAAAIRARK